MDGQVQGHIWLCCVFSVEEQRPLVSVRCTSLLRIGWVVVRSVY